MGTSSISGSTFTPSTNVRLAEVIQFTFAPVTISAPTQYGVTIPGLKAGDMVIISNTMEDNNKTDYSITPGSALAVVTDDTLVFGICPKVDPGGGVFDTITTSGDWFAYVLRPGFLEGLPLDAVVNL